MKLKRLIAVICLCAALQATAQQPSGIDTAIRNLAAEKDPKKIVFIVNSIIKEHGLDKEKNSETLDVLYGTAAVNFALLKKYSQFEKCIDLIRNKFNKTSFLNMAASKMLDDNVDAGLAKIISERTLTLYHSFKKDTSARPKDYSNEDWQRFMDFAQYPYYDTYAHALFELKKYEEALRYQKMAFDGQPEDGLAGSVERYAKLLQLTGEKEAAKQLLLKMAGKGRLNKGMEEQLQSMGNSSRFLDSLQNNVQATLVAELRLKMLDQPAPVFSLKDINGRLVKLSDYAGKIVVLDLWATWCKPCIASFPAMQLMVKKHPEAVFLFIAVDEKDSNPLPAIKRFIEKENYTFTVLVDEPVSPNSSKYKITSSYQPDGIPAKYIIDKSGMLRFKTSGFDTDRQLMNEMEAMFSILQ